MCPDKTRKKKSSDTTSIRHNDQNAVLTDKHIENITKELDFTGLDDTPVSRGGVSSVPSSGTTTPLTPPKQSVPQPQPPITGMGILQPPPPPSN